MARRAETAVARRGCAQRIGRWTALLLAAGALGAASEGPPPLDEAVAALPRSPEAALALVRKRIAYRPYAGFVKGPRGAWWDGTANAADAADLLLEVLRRKGIGGRLAFGRLADGDLTHLLEKVFARAKPPAEVQAKLPGETLADPVHDPAIRAIAARHVWVQVRDGDGWIDLDPFAFGAGANTTVATRERTAGRPLPGDRRRLRIQVFATMAGGKLRRVLRAEEVVSELVGRRVVFMSHGVDAKARDRKLSADRLRPALLLGRRLVRGAPYVPPFLAPRRDPIGRIGDALDRVDQDKKPAALESVVMEVTLVGGGLPERTERRYLYLAGRDGLDRLGELTFFCVVFGGPPDRLVRQWPTPSPARRRPGWRPAHDGCWRTSIAPSAPSANAPTRGCSACRWIRVGTHYRPTWCSTRFTRGRGLGRRPRRRAALP